MRSERLRECLSCSNPLNAWRLHNSLNKFAGIANRGFCFDDGRFILDSRLAFLRKKRGTVPHPIRVGEFWRRFIAKKLIAEHREDIATICKNYS